MITRRLVWICLLCAWFLPLRGAAAVDQETLETELNNIAGTLYGIIIKGDPEALGELLAQDILERRSDGSWTSVGGGVRLNSVVSDEDSGFVSTEAVLRALRKRHGEAYARVFDTAQYRRLPSPEDSWCRIGMGCLTRREWVSIRDLFRNAGKGLWWWVEVQMPRSGRNGPPRGVIHHQWPGKSRTNYAAPGFVYVGGRWWLEDYFVLDLEPIKNALSQMAWYARAKHQMATP